MDASLAGLLKKPDGVIKGRYKYKDFINILATKIDLNFSVV